MKPIDPTKPIDSSQSGTKAKPIVIDSATIIGGDNCINLLRAGWWKIVGGHLGPPAGVPGDSNHAICLNRCHDVEVCGVQITTNGSDGVNLWNSKDCRISGCTFMGPLYDGTDNPQEDIGVDVCVDGTGSGGPGNVVDNMLVRHLTWACGSGTIGPGVYVAALNRIQIGCDGAYGKSRNKFISVTLIGVSKNRVYVAKGVKKVSYQ
jgi:hypothetical protein